jgi:hypothetical protein
LFAIGSLGRAQRASKATELTVDADFDANHTGRTKDPTDCFDPMNVCELTHGADQRLEPGHGSGHSGSHTKSRSEWGAPPVVEDPSERLGPVVWVVIAVGLAIAVIWFRIGVGFVAVGWLKDDGRLDTARYMRAFLLLTWTGAASVVVGALLGVLALKVVGFTFEGTALLVQFSMVAAAHRRRRQRSTR